MVQAALRISTRRSVVPSSRELLARQRLLHSIRAINPAADENRLSDFPADVLQVYLERLQVACAPRRQRLRWERRDGVPGIVTRTPRD